MKTERFEMRLDPETVGRIDDWRSRQSDLPSRAEAMRRLVDAQLLAMDKPPLHRIRISDGEKLILSILADLIKHLNVRNGSIDPDFLEETLFTEHYWGFGWKYTGLFDGPIDTPEPVHEVCDILEMWHCIERDYSDLPQQDQDLVADAVAPFGKNPTFPGFDGNDESDHLSCARYLINHLDRFVRFKGRDINSHMGSLASHRRMLSAFRPMKEPPAYGKLSAAQIIALLNERIHPDHR